MRHVARVSVVGVAVLAAASLIRADVVVRAKAIELYANIETVSVYVPYDGDENANATATVAFRKVGAGAWTEGHPLVRIRGSRFAGSIFGVKPKSEYEVRVTVTDPDGAGPAELMARTRTRIESFPVGSGRHMYVSPGGDDASAGTETEPFRTIQHAVDEAKPGDHIVARPGVYRESVRIRTSGKPDDYLLVRGLPGAKIVGLPDPDAAGRLTWEKVEDDLYKAKPGYRTRYIAVDGKRLYYWKDLEMLKRGTETRRDKVYAVKGGWTQETDGTLYVRLGDGGRPEDPKMQITQRTDGIVLDGVRHVIVQGFDIGYFGDYCLRLNNSSACAVQHNVLHNSRHGMRIDGPTSHNNLVEGNELYDTSVWDWPWQLCKAHDPEGSAIVLTGGRGTVVRRNRIHGFFNAIVPSLWGRLDDERFNGDMDVHDNEMWDVGDDCLEPEGTCINQRYWENRMRGALMGISLAPITTGPCYFIRNTVFDHHLSAVKLSNDTSGPCFLYHNTFVTTVHDTDKYSSRKDVNGIGNSGAYHNMTYRNNIIQGTDHAYCDWRRERPRGLSMDYDNLWTTSGTHFFMYGKRYGDFETTRKETGFEEHGMSVDAQFVDLQAGDLRLKADSPLIDKGVRLPNINDDFAGAAPDIGAFEHR